MLVFFDRGAEGIERLTVSRSAIGQFYKSVWEPEKIDQWKAPRPDRPGAEPEADRHQRVRHLQLR